MCTLDDGDGKEVGTTRGQDGRKLGRDDDGGSERGKDARWLNTTLPLFDYNI